VLINKRLSEISEEDNSDKIVCLHIASLASLYNNVQLEMSSIDENGIDFSFIKSDDQNKIYKSFNYDGLLFCSLNEKQKTTNYIQLFRNGIIEISDFTMFKESTLLYNHENRFVINGCQFENFIEDIISKSICALSKVENTYPFFISISLLNTKNCRIDNGVIYVTGFNGNLIPENDLILPPIYIENEKDMKKKLIYSYNVLWNSSGYAKSLNIEQESSNAR
jgi:hypothetical protein